MITDKESGKRKHRLTSCLQDKRFRMECSLKGGGTRVFYLEPNQTSHGKLVTDGDGPDSVQPHRYRIYKDETLCDVLQVPSPDRF